MPLSTEQRKDTLIKSFELLKDNWDNNERSLRDIMGKMWPIDADMATNMWIYLLKKHKSAISSDGLTIIACILNPGIEGIGLAKITDIVISNEILKSAIFEKSNYIYWACAEIIGLLISTKRPSIANDLLDLVRKNKVRRISFTEFLIDVIERTNNPEKLEEIYEYFVEWSKSMETEEDRAKINVKLLDLF